METEDNEEGSSSHVGSSCIQVNTILCHYNIPHLSAFNSLYQQHQCNSSIRCDVGVILLHSETLQNCVQLLGPKIGNFCLAHFFLYVK